MSETNHGETEFGVMDEDESFKPLLAFRQMSVAMFPASFCRCHKGEGCLTARPGGGARAHGRQEQEPVPAYREHPCW
jgi:hypothetical protein